MKIRALFTELGWTVVERELRHCGWAVVFGLWLVCAVKALVLIVK